MKNYLYNSWLLATLSGLLSVMAILHFNFSLTWICFVPIFIAINNKSSIQTFKIVLVYAFTFSCFAFYWMIPGAFKFTGLSIFYGIGAFAIASIYYMLFCSVLFSCFKLIKIKDANLASIAINGLLAASIFSVAEALLLLISAGLPWFDVHAGNGLASNMYAVQPAAIFGISILTFIAILVNYLIALLINQKAWKKLYIPFTIIAMYLFTGFSILKYFDSTLIKNKKIRTAILAENIMPNITWDNNTGNLLVKKLLTLNRSAVLLKPDLAIWSESAIPWTYRKDDDLIKKIFTITDPINITHIIGINTEYANNKVYNSAYCFLPGGLVTGRYDKQHLLTFIEKPLNGWLMPFFSSNGYSVMSDTLHSNPLTTPFGKAGILICNEAILPAATQEKVKQGAGFLINMSNDGWFNNTYITDAHYLYARIRAVEARKDIAINCNNGWSGLIKANGILEEKEKSTEPFVKLVMIEPNDYRSFVTNNPSVLIYGCVLFLLILIGRNLFNTKT